jgi:hypothetical protein
MVKRRVPPAGFFEPCIPILAHKPPAGPQWSTKSDTTVTG